MLRLVLALALALVIGALGCWFAIQQPEAGSDPTTRARSVPEPRMKPVPEIEIPRPEPPDGTRPLDSVPPPAEADQAAALPLIERNLSPPLSNLKASDIHDTFYQWRGGGKRPHEATDIMAPRGTPVLAVDDGIVKKLFTSKPGGLTIYQFDSSNQYCFYYAHLDRYAEGLAEGQLVLKGTVIGYVGSTGNADLNAPHLHFAIFKLGPEKNWWQGEPINPYPLLMSMVRR